MNELHKQVTEALKKLPPFKRVVVGLSGGMDSVTLTYLLKSMGYEVVVAHLNHQLRGISADQDEAFVIRLAKKWNLPYITRKAVLPKKGNLEHNARAIRYSFLEEVRDAYQADFIAVGHHFDDQIETILMHKKRGSGLRGKRGMSLMKEKVIRPMLDAPRSMIEAYVRDHDLDYVVDESNFDLTFDRNHLRHKVIPKLRKKPGFEEQIRASSRAARDRLETLQAEKSEWLKKHYEKDRIDRHAFKGLAPDLQVEILLDLLGQSDVYSKTLGRLINFIENGKTGKEVVIKGKLFVIEYDKVRCVPEDKAQLDRQTIEGTTLWGPYQIKVSGIKPLYVRSWKAGDRFQPSGMTGSKKLQDFFVDAKVPRYDRKQIPIIVDEKDDIICVGDLRFSDPHKALSNKIKIKKQD